ncbi:hypothetical protein WR25_24607 [Diploscapter pachys]|uniref:C-type lectin domain-containing protein n=1 Tax=Diploscapter pachys TaxID=2018661 RepID=A0A2A2JC41_9BILA|nr:hypothetical protein WR25_24607 [Diploscapter pachys]
MFVYDSCFAQLTPGDNRDNSLAECVNLNPMAHLWFPTSGPQNDAVQLEFGRDYWLGIHEEPPPGSDNWVYDDGSPLVYTHWYMMGGQPDPGPGVGPETCVRLFYKLVDMELRSSRVVDGPGPTRIFRV